MDIFGITVTSLIPIISVTGAVMMRNIFSRFTALEQESKKALDEAKVRQLIEDKLEVIRLRQNETREALKKIFELLYQYKPTDDHNNHEGK